MLPQLGLMEMLIVMGIAVLLFGKRLPEVGRSLGKGIIEFKKGLAGLEDGLDLTSTSVPSTRRSHDYTFTNSQADANVDSAVPKFEPPTSAPVPQMEYQPETKQG